MITEIRHTGIVVQDLNSVINFFTKLLGFKIKKKMNEFEEMYEELDTLEKSIENYNYYVELKKERNELENTINEFNKTTHR